MRWQPEGSNVIDTFGLRGGDDPEGWPWAYEHARFMNTCRFTSVDSRQGLALMPCDWVGRKGRFTLSGECLQA